MYCILELRSSERRPMSIKINKDHSRFKKIVRGHLKQDLKKYISNGDFVTQQGKDKVSIPVPRINIPQFQFDPKESGGVSQGDGEVGDSMQPGDPDGEGSGPGEAGENPGEHVLETEVTLDELAGILGESLALPNIKPKGSKNLESLDNQYTGINNNGPESLRHFKRTYKQALKRQISSGEYNPKNPIIIPQKDDKRFRSQKITNKPISQASIIYMMDVSGSMGEEQKEIVRITAFWIDTWLNSQYQNLESRFIIHDAVAKEVDRETFFRTRESGGTSIFSAYELCSEIIEKDYPEDSWNIYPFHFSDGDNWSDADTVKCLKILKENIFPKINMFAYGQVTSPYGSGLFIDSLLRYFESEEKLTTSLIDRKEDIYYALKDFFESGS